MKEAAALLALALLAAGCLGAPAPVDTAADEPAPRPGVAIVQDRPEPTFSANVTTGRTVAPDTAATLERPPALVPGEWWRIKFRSPIDGAEVEFIRVVADVQDGDYVVGMPHEGWYKEAVIYHAPGFGDVNGDLSYDTHDNHFVPVKFPLTDEQSWETSFSGGPTMRATVQVGEDQTAKVTFEQVDGGDGGGGLGAVFNTLFPNPGGPLLELVYDAKVHEVVSFRHATVEYEVVEHGYGFEGWITIPRGEDLVFIHGRFLTPAVGFGLQPAPPTETVTISGGYNRVTFIHVVGGFTGTVPGAYRERTVAPDGTEYVTEALGEANFAVQFYENAAPDGDWTLEHVAAGPGIVFIEGIAYHQYDIHLPTGGKRADHSHDVIR